MSRNKETTMLHTRPPAAVLALLITGLAVGGCARSEAAAPADAERVVTVEQIPGTELNKVTLSEGAAHRLGVQLDVVRQVEVKGLPRKVVPYAAVLYSPMGDTYAYQSPEPWVFVRAPLTVDFVQGDLAVLLDGPPEGTAVATVGAPELLGAESGVGGE
jgi:hypothetical protein